MSTARTVHSRRRLLATLGLVCAAGCASNTLRPETLSASATVLPTPLVEQDELHECGLAALSSLCGYYQVAIPEAATLRAGASDWGPAWRRRSASR